MITEQTICAITWFTPDEWLRLKLIAADRDAMDDTYQDWAAGAESLMRELRDKGVLVEKVDTRVDDLLEWCSQKQCKLDGEARAAYAAEKIRKQNLQ